MTEDLDRRLREGFGKVELPAAPETLHAAMSRLVAEPVAQHAPLRRRLLPAVSAFSVLVVTVAATAIILGSLNGPLGPGGSIPVQPSCAGVEASKGCIEPTPLPSGGLTRDAAIAAARREVPGGADARLVWAHVEPNPFVEPFGSGPAAWEVRLEGVLDGMASCPPNWLDHQATASDRPCRDGDSGIVAVLDYSSGALLGWIH